MQVVYGLETGAAYCVGAWWKGLANNHMTDDQRAALSPDSEEFRLRVGGSNRQVLGWGLYTTLLWLLKACMAIFYSRLTYVSPRLEVVTDTDTDADTDADADGQGRSDQHAYPRACGLRGHRGDLSDCDSVDPVWLPSDAQELADLSKSWP